jgi:8-oxo-dGTP diphosphatase
MSQTPEGERPAIAAAIVVEDGQVLMVRRQVRGDLSWQFRGDGASDEGARPPCASRHGPDHVLRRL